MRFITFKYVKNKFIENLLILKKVKNEYQLNYNWLDNNADKSDLKIRNWIATFHDQMNKSIIGYIINKPGNDKELVKYWIQEMTNNTISSSVQLPIIKRCRRCNIKTDQVRKSNAKSNDVEKIENILEGGSVELCLSHY
ncbi:hypothetical protein C1646_768154 [Rhizophagus diaphanus]|nr:hypothetical protein C1646_768154 [Rhizophagus diaphanus] [Rhizophagus sp. MUCL 43196]